MAQIVTITTHDDLLLQLGEAVHGQAAVVPVESLTAALELLSDKRQAQLLIIDARGVMDLRADVDQVSKRVPHAVTLVYAGAEAQQQVGLQVQGSSAFAMLPSPLDSMTVSAIIETAIAEARDKLAAAPAPAASMSIPTLSPAPKATFPSPAARLGAATISPPSAEPSSAKSSPASGTGALPLWIGGGLAVVLAAVLGSWLIAGSDDVSMPAESRQATSPETAPSPPEEEASLAVSAAPEIPLLQGSLDELLEKARFAMRERRYTEPAADNALLYYRSAVAVDANNPEALDGLTRVAALLVTRFEEAMAQGRYEEAAQSLGFLKAAAPNDVRLSEFELRVAQGQINEAIAAGSIDRAAALIRQAEQRGAMPADQLARWRAEIARGQDDARVRRLVSLANERIRQDRLIEPGNDSAKFYVGQLRESAPSNADAQRTSRALISAYFRKAREAALANRSGEAERWLAEANEAGVSAADIAAYHRELAGAYQRAAAAEADRLAQLARERIQQGRLTEPAQDSATHYLSALEIANRNHTALAPASRELADRLLERARTAAREGRTAQMEADLALARRWGADARSVQAVQQTTTAAPVSPPPAQQTVDLEALQEKLKRVRHVAPTYPDRALSDGIAGVVVVEFTVGVRGETRNVRVVSSDPTGVFDQSAIAAVSRWRYEPVVVNGAPVEVPTRTLIRYALPD